MHPRDRLTNRDGHCGQLLKEVRSCNSRKLICIFGWCNVRILRLLEASKRWKPLASSKLERMEEKAEHDRSNSESEPKSKDSSNSEPIVEVTKHLKIYISSIYGWDICMLMNIASRECLNIVLQARHLLWLLFFVHQCLTNLLKTFWTESKIGNEGQRDKSICTTITGYLSFFFSYCLFFLAARFVHSAPHEISPSFRVAQL